VTPKEEEMTEPSTDQNQPAGGGTPPEGTGTPDEPKAVTAEDLARVQAALEKERDLHKQAKQQLSQLNQSQRAAMDEGERKILEAREAAAAEVRTQYGSRLAQTEFRAAAAARNAGYDVGKALAYVDLSKFVGEDGEPDTKAIKAAVADLVPAAEASEPPPSFDGGSRTTANGGTSMTQLIRQAAGRA
jgi:hypothetical protein